MKKQILPIILLCIGISSVHGMGMSMFASSDLNTTYDRSETIILEDFTVLNLADSTEVYFVTFSGGQSGSTSSRYLTDGSNQISYGIYDDTVGSTILRDIEDEPASNEVLSGTVGSYATEGHSYAVIVDPDQFPPAGSYTDTFTIGLYTGTVGDLPSAQEEDTQSVNLTVTVEPVLDVALVDTGQPFNEEDTSLSINFGTLYYGDSRGGDIVVRANTIYSLSLNSFNGGIMVNDIVDDDSTVPYTLQIDGASLTLPAGTETLVTSGAGPTSVTGQRYSFNVSIGDFGMATEGDYHDEITVTVTAQ